jgi:hypothetical protein
MRILVGFLFGFLFTTTASAQFDKFTGNTVFQAIQCDVGRFGAIAKRSGIDPRMKAHVVYSYTVEKSQKVAVSAGVTTIVSWLVKGPSVEVARTWTRTNKNTLDGTFNINEGNTDVCKKGNVPSVPVGVFECLKDSIDPIKKKVVETCEDTRVAAGTLKADGTVKWIFVQAGAEGDWDIKATYNFRVEAPAKDEQDDKDKKDKV